MVAGQRRFMAERGEDVALLKCRSFASAEESGSYVLPHSIDSRAFGVLKQSFSLHLGEQSSPPLGGVGIGEHGPKPKGILMVSGGTKFMTNCGVFPRETEGHAWECFLVGRKGGGLVSCNREETNRTTRQSGGGYG